MAKKILIIEDDEDTRELVEEILLDEGYEVLAASNWIEGTKLVFGHKPEFILLDVNLPFMKGPQGLEVLRSTLKELPKIIFFSGMERSALEALVKKHGVEGYIQKGKTPVELLLEIEKFLQL